VTTDAAGQPLTSLELQMGSEATALEGVVVQLANVVVTDVNPPLGAGDTAPSNEFVVDGGVRVNDYLHLIMPPAVLGAGYASLAGVLELRNASYKIEPRADTDAVLGPPRLVQLGPDGFVRLGQMSVPAIPAPLQATLSRAATADTVVALSSGDPASLGVPAQVTIPMGSASAPVPVSGLQLTAMGVPVTATLDGVNAVGQVRVIDVAQAPMLVDLEPQTAAVAVGGTLQMTVTLDVPAPAGGAMVALACTTAGTVPASVTVAQDALTGNFSYAQMGAAGTDTVTATLGAVSKMATVKASAHIVLNEIDYDQPGTDTNEYIELYNGTGSAADISHLAVVFVNGANNLEYARVALTGTLAADGYLVIASSTVMVDLNATKVLFGAASNNIQNGNPDGVLILDTQTGEVVDALSYGGSITMATINGVTGPRSLVEGTAATATDSGTSPGALIRNPNGHDSDNAATDWVFTTTLTPGAANVKTP
jgi:hypothetical protein